MSRMCEALPSLPSEPPTPCSCHPSTHDALTHKTPYIGPLPLHAHDSRPRTRPSIHPTPPPCKHTPLSPQPPLPPPFHRRRPAGRGPVQSESAGRRRRTRFADAVLNAAADGKRGGWKSGGSSSNGGGGSSSSQGRSSKAMRFSTNGGEEEIFDEWRGRGDFRRMEGRRRSKWKEATTADNLTRQGEFRVGSDFEVDQFFEPVRRGIRVESGCDFTRRGGAGEAGGELKSGLRFQPSMTRNRLGIGSNGNRRGCDAKATGMTGNRLKNRPENDPNSVRNDSESTCDRE
jgi:hypothetical protein